MYVLEAAFSTDWAETNAGDADDKNKVHGYENDCIDNPQKRSNSSSYYVNLPYIPETHDCEVYVLEGAFTTDGAATDAAGPNEKKKEDRYPMWGEPHDSIYEICMRLSKVSIAE